MRNALALRLFVICAAALGGWCGAAPPPAAAENWTQWRGPDNRGLSSERDLPIHWSPTENILWRTPLPGPAGATPVVWEDRIFLTSAEGQDLVVLGLNTDGDILWKHVQSTGDQPVRGDEGNYASPSPATDGQRVYATMANGSVAAYDFDGHVLWQVDLQQRYGAFSIAFGLSSTPVLYDGRLYFQCLHSNGKLAIALDAATGDEVWAVTRASDARAECEHSYASPMLYRDDELVYLLTHGADYIVAHSLEDGSELWRCGGLNPKGAYREDLRFVASPVAVPGLIVVPSAKNHAVLGLDPRARGDITDSEAGHLWEREAETPDVPSPLVHAGLVYLLRENGELICLDAQTGEEVYLQRLYSDRYRASPVYADGYLYCASRDGTVSVVRAGRQFEVVAENKLGEALSASPVISGGRLYLRTFDALYAIAR